jgi:hypothetical protein
VKIIKDTPTALGVIAAVFVSLGIGRHEFDTVFWISLGIGAVMCTLVPFTSGFISARRRAKRQRAEIRRMDREIRRYQADDLNLRHVRLGVLDLPSVRRQPPGAPAPGPIEPPRPPRHRPVSQ